MTRSVDEVEDLVQAPEPAPRTKRKRLGPGETQKLPLRTWLKICGQKADQTAGFRSWAVRQKLRDRTAAEWNEAYSAFLKRIV